MTCAPVTFASGFVLEPATVRGSGALALVEGKPKTRVRRVRVERVAAVFALGRSRCHTRNRLPELEHLLTLPHSLLLWGQVPLPGPDPPGRNDEAA
jgi:hypothetical protein